MTKANCLTNPWGRGKVLPHLLETTDLLWKLPGKKPILFAKLLEEAWHLQQPLGKVFAIILDKPSEMDIFYVNHWKCIMLIPGNPWSSVSIPGNPSSSSSIPGSPSPSLLSLFCVHPLNYTFSWNHIYLYVGPCKSSIFCADLQNSSSASTTLITRNFIDAPKFLSHNYTQ